MFFLKICFLFCCFTTSLASCTVKKNVVIYCPYTMCLGEIENILLVVVQKQLKSTLEVMRETRLSNLRRYEEELMRITEDHLLELPPPGEASEPEEQFPGYDMYRDNREGSHGSYWFPL